MKRDDNTPAVPHGAGAGAHSGRGGISPTDVQELQHAEAMIRPKGIERGIIMMMDGIQLYVADYQKELDAYVGDDGVLGEYVSEIFDGLRGILNGPAGRLDCGKFAAMLRRVATENNVEYPQ